MSADNLFRYYSATLKGLYEPKALSRLGGAILPPYVKQLMENLDSCAWYYDKTVAMEPFQIGEKEKASEYLDAMMQNIEAVGVVLKYRTSFTHSGFADPMRKKAQEALNTFQHQHLTDIVRQVHFVADRHIDPSKSYYEPGNINLSQKDSDFIKSVKSRIEAYEPDKETAKDLSRRHFLKPALVLGGVAIGVFGLQKGCERMSDNVTGKLSEADDRPYGQTGDFNDFEKDATKHVRMGMLEDRLTWGFGHNQIRKKLLVVTELHDPNGPEGNRTFMHYDYEGPEGIMRNLTFPPSESNRGRRGNAEARFHLSSVTPLNHDEYQRAKKFLDKSGKNKVPYSGFIKLHVGNPFKNNSSAFPDVDLPDAPYFMEFGDLQKARPSEVDKLVSEFIPALSHALFEEKVKEFRR